MLVKLYGEPAGAGPEKRYSPAECTGAKKVSIIGSPEKKRVSFSKKIDSHIHALSLYFVFYNFARQQETLRISPVMAAGISDRLWIMEDIVALVDAREAPPKKRGPYKKRGGEKAA